jgi:hypothetical protein
MRLLTATRLFSSREAWTSTRTMLRIRIPMSRTSTVLMARLYRSSRLGDADPEARADSVDLADRVAIAVPADVGVAAVVEGVPVAPVAHPRVAAAIAKT